MMLLAHPQSARSSATTLDGFATRKAAVVISDWAGGMHTFIVVNCTLQCLLSQNFVTHILLLLRGITFVALLVVCCGRKIDALQTVWSNILSSVVLF